jgi:hypothetical protein
MLRRFIGLFSALAISTTVLAATASVASAQIQICDGGQRQLTFSSLVTKPAILHEFGVSLAPHTSFSESATLTTTKVITASVTGESGVSGGANFVIYHAEASLKMTLMLSGSHTNSNTVAYTTTVTNPTAGQLRFALWDATTQVTGKYRDRTCDVRGLAWINVHSGTVFSARTVHWFGTAMCPRGWYATGTTEWWADYELGC